MADHPAALPRSQTMAARSSPRSRRFAQGQKVVVGICALDKKARSKPMEQILSRLLSSGEFEVKFFGDECIHGLPVEEWPACDALISFYSDGFPLAKAEAYAALRKPYLVNDLGIQHVLLDRRRVYAVLQENGIAVPPHAIVTRDAHGNTDVPFEETEQGVMVNGVAINKPFVEKPISGEDHNVYVYYPPQMGGGGKRLFRKQEDRSAAFDPELNQVRRDGSYLYETFMQTMGTDVKVYTVGPSYAHAEARKSPTVDGRVHRDSDGKEVRYPVLLSTAEKEIARRVVLAFRQAVCGFDLLRCGGRSYVCDVNGWSFVKNSARFYDDTSRLLRTLILSHVAPHVLVRSTSLTSASALANFMQREVGGLDLNSTATTVPRLGSSASLAADTSTTAGSIAGETVADVEELRCVLAVIRHGDRTPKQKNKLRLRDAAFLQLYAKHRPAGSSKPEQVKLKSAEQLSDVLHAARDMLVRLEAGQPCGLTPDEDPGEKAEKLRAVIAVLSRKSTDTSGQTSFAGINRKVQLKPVTASESAGGGSQSEGDGNAVTELLVVVKHGGVLTHAGRSQAEALGADFRHSIYPGASEGGEGGTGLLRLHSTYRHDLKIWSSDEGRVQMSAAAFAKTLLDLEGTSLAPILVSLVNLNGFMLEKLDKGASEGIQTAKQQLAAYMTDDANAGARSPSPKPAGSLSSADPPSPTTGTTGAFAESRVSLSTDARASLDALMPADMCPAELLRRLLVSVSALREEIQERIWSTHGKGGNPVTTGSTPPSGACSDDTLFTTLERWRKLEKGLYNARRGTFDISKVPDVFDAAKYDALHARHWGLSNVREVYDLAKQLANVVIPNEYGITPAQKLSIGASVCSVLVGKMLRDFSAVREEAVAAWGNDTAANPSAALGDSRLRSHLRMPSSSDTDANATDDGDDDSVFRLHPQYADDVKSKDRHVRTRLYFTSESHMHSLLNVIRFARLAGEHATLVSPEGERVLADTRELDYCCSIVIRMFERPSLPPTDPRKFRVELQFSPGAVGDPFDAADDTHALPVAPRVVLNDHSECTLAMVEEALGQFVADWRSKGCPELGADASKTAMPLALREP